MSDDGNLTNHFLIAMPALEDPNFHRTVTYICEHNPDGALGIVINRPTDITLGELLEHMELEAAGAEIARRSVFLGGPVQRERGFVLHPPAANQAGQTGQTGQTTATDPAGRTPGSDPGPQSGPQPGTTRKPGSSGWESSITISDSIAVTTSRDILAAIADNAGPKRYMVALGYAGWGAGQLEQELADNAWLFGPADPDILFDLGPAERWKAAAALLGVDLSLLSGNAGHA